MGALLKLRQISPLVVLEAAGVCGLAGALSLASRHFGLIQFGGMDGGTLSSAAWQIHRDYRPYTDFVNGFPPIFLIGAGLAVEWFGVAFSSFITLAALWSALCFMVQHALLRAAGLSVSLAFAVTLFAQLTAGFATYWWYNQVTLTLVLLLVCAAFAFLRLPGSLFVRASLVAISALLLLSKPNTAFPALLLAYVVMAWGTRRWKLLGALAALATIAAYAILGANGISPAMVATSYAIAGRRVLDLGTGLRFLLVEQIWEARQTAVITVPLWFALGLLRHSLKPLKPAAALAWGCLPLVLLGAAGNVSLNSTELPPLMVAAVFLTTPLCMPLFEARRRRVALAAILSTSFLLALNATRIGATRLNIMEDATGAFYEEAPLAELRQPAFFRGMRVAPALQRAVSDMDRTLASFGECASLYGGVYFGPRVDFGYPAFNLDAPRALPLRWEPFHDGVSPAAHLMIDRFQQRPPGLCIFLHNDYTFLPLELRRQLRRNYTVHQLGAITVHVLPSVEACAAPLSGPMAALRP